jgi:hypothetical protein
LTPKSSPQEISATSFKNTPKITIDNADAVIHGAT